MIEIGNNTTMKNVVISNGAYISDEKCIINGQEVGTPPEGVNNTTVINNVVFCNGYEYKNGRWQKTLRALWYKYF